MLALPYLYLKQLIVWQTLRTVADDFFLPQDWNTDRLPPPIFPWQLSSHNLDSNARERTNAHFIYTFQYRLTAWSIPFKAWSWTGATASNRPCWKILEYDGIIYNHPWRHVTLKVKLYQETPAVDICMFRSSSNKPFYFSVSTREHPSKGPLIFGRIS